MILQQNSMIKREIMSKSMLEVSWWMPELICVLDFFNLISNAYNVSRGMERPCQGKGLVYVKTS